MKRVLSLILVLGSLVPAAAGAAPAGPPPDYETMAGLSQPVHTDIVRESIYVPMRDGVGLYAEITRPAGVANLGVVMEISPYHQSAAARRGFLAAFYPPRGYAVVVADVRGTGNSEGCLDYLGPVDRLDFYDLVEWAATQSWSNGRVGIVGVSYVGSTPIAAAAARPPHLATIVPIAGLAQMYDHEFQGGVPYVLQWVGPAAAYEQLAAQPPDDQTDTQRFALNAANAGCGTPNSAAMTGIDFYTGRYTPWHAARDYRDQAAGTDIPIFLVHGTQDRAVRPIAMDWFLKRGLPPGDKLWFGQWGHQASDRGDQWEGALHAWFDKHLLLMAVDTGPPVEIFLPGEVVIFGGPVRTATSWPESNGALLFYPRADGSLASTPPIAESTAVFDAVPQVGLGPPVRDALRFDSAPLAADREIAGTPSIMVNETITPAHRVDLIVTILDVFPSGTTREISQAALNPELRHGLGDIVPVQPDEEMLLYPPAWPTDYLVRAGHKIRVVISSEDGDKVPIAAGPGLVSVTLGGINPTHVMLPVVTGATYYRDPRFD